MGIFGGFASSHSLICNCNYETPTPTSIHPSGSRTQGHFPKDTFPKRKLACAPATDLNYRLRDLQAREGPARPPTFPHFTLKMFLTQAAPKGSALPGHLLKGLFRGIHATEDPSQRGGALRPPGRAQHRPGPTAPSQTPAPRPRPGRATAPGRGRGRRGGSLPLGRRLLHAGAAAAPRGRCPSARAPPAPTAPERPRCPRTRGPRPPPAALRLPPLPLPPAAAGTRPPAPLIGYSRAMAGADRLARTSLRAAAASKPRPPRAERALPRRREGKIMEAAVLPSSRHAPQGAGPRGTPGDVVRPRGVPASQAGRNGSPAAPFRLTAGPGRCAPGQGRPRAAPPPQGGSSPAAAPGQSCRAAEPSSRLCAPGEAAAPAPPSESRSPWTPGSRAGPRGSSGSVTAGRGGAPRSRLG